MADAMITLSYWTFFVIMILASGVACWIGIHVGYRRGYHQGYWAFIIKEQKK